MTNTIKISNKTFEKFESNRLYAAPGWERNTLKMNNFEAEAFQVLVSLNPRRCISISAKDGKVTLQGFEDVDAASKAFFDELMHHAEKHILPIAEKQKEIYHLKYEIDRYERYVQDEVLKVRNTERGKSVELLKEKFKNKKIIVTNIDELVEILNGI